MISSLINAISGFIQTILSFLGKIGNAIFGFFVHIFRLFWDTVVWVFEEVFAYVYNTAIDGLSYFTNFNEYLSFPPEIYYWYHQLNYFFPVSETLTIAVFLLQTWVMVTFARLIIKAKFFAFKIKNPFKL